MTPEQEARKRHRLAKPADHPGYFFDCSHPDCERFRKAPATPDSLRAALDDVRSNWPSHYGPDQAKAWIAACDRVEGALATDTAPLTTPDPLRAALSHTPLSVDELAEVRTRAGFAVLDVPPDRFFEDWHDAATTDRARLLATLDARTALVRTEDTKHEPIDKDNGVEYDGYAHWVECSCGWPGEEWGQPTVEAWWKHSRAALATDTAPLNKHHCIPGTCKYCDTLTALVANPAPLEHPIWEGTGTCPYCGIFVPDTKPAKTELEPCDLCDSTDRWLHYETCGRYYGGACIR